MSEKESASTGSRGPALRATTVDEAIDRAVRQIVRIDPRPGMEARVRSRLAVPAPRRSIYGSRLPAFGAALAMLVLIVGLLRSGSAPTLMAPTVRAPEPVAGGESAPARVGPVAGSGSASSLEGTVPDQIPPAAAVAPREPVPAAPRPRAVAPTDPGLHAEAISMPQIENLFGTGGNRVSGANFLGREAGSLLVPATNRGGPPIALADLPMPALRIEPIRIAPIPAPGKGR